MKFPNFNPYLEVLVAAIIWGSTGAFVKYLHLPPTTITAFRLAVPAIFLLIIFLIQKKKIFQWNTALLLASALNAVRMLFYFIGFTLTSIGNAVIVLYTWPIFASIGSFFLLKEKVTWQKIVLIGLAFSGIVLVYFGKEISFVDKDFIGMGAVLLSALVSGFIMVIFKKELEKYSRFETIYYQNLIGGIIFLPFLFINRPFPTSWQISIATIYAILIGVVGFTLFFAGLKKMNTSTASTLAYVEVLSGLAFAVILFKETITWNMVLGGTLIIITTIILQRISKREGLLSIEKKNLPV